MAWEGIHAGIGQADRMPDCNEYRRRAGSAARAAPSLPMTRDQQIHAWLARVLAGAPYSLAPASADASFRRYLRVTFADGATAIVMDAPPAHEDVRPWLTTRQLFAAAGVNVPEVMAADVDAGLVLITDFGDATYLAALAAGEDADRLYRAALASLVTLQGGSRPGVLPEYGRELLLRELELFPDWYLARHLGLTLDEEEKRELHAVFEAILAVNLAEPRVFVHRDYHSRNLMHCGETPGIIDFQDAVYGPISYDLVSLLKDAYVAWDEEIVLDWLIRYWEQAKKARLPVAADFGEFYRAFEWMGVQRHLKVLGIFARLKHRDGKEAYLADMPRVFGYLHSTCRRYGRLAPLCRLLDRIAGATPEIAYTF